MKRVILLPVLAGLVLGAQPVYGDATLTSVTDFSGNVSFDNSYTDWKLFAPANNSGSPVELSGGGSLISDISADGTITPGADGTITASWSSGTPVASADDDPGFLAGIVGYQYGGTPCSYMAFSVTSPAADYTIDIYLRSWGFGYDANLTLDNAGTINTYPAYADSLGWVSYQHLVIDVTGSTLDSPTTITFDNFQGDDDWGQFDIYSADVVAVPEPATLALAGLGGLSLLLFRRRRSTCR